MSKINFSKSKFSKFLSSKGFYTAIALCLVGAGAATWLAVDRTITGIERSSNPISENRFSDFPLAEETETKAEGIKKEPAASIKAAEPVETIKSAEPSEPLSSSSISALDSAPPSEQALKSEQSQASEKLSGLAYASPISGSIINEYSNGELVKSVTLGDWRTHDGIDIAVGRGADIYAVADGIVKDIKNDHLWGTVITIEHPDGNQSIYCGLNSVVPVKVGEQVMAKQAIGKVDGIPCEIFEESHIHFAMKQNGEWIDPLSIVPR